MNTSTTRIGILGPGAIGSAMEVALLSNPKNQVVSIGRSKRKFKHFLYKDSIYELSDPLKEVTDPFDLLIVCLKAYHYPDAEYFIRRVMEQNTPVLLVGNGVNLADRLKSIQNRDLLVESVIDCPVQTEDGNYHQLKKGRLIIPNGCEDWLYYFKQAPNLAPALSEDLKSEAWMKACEATALGSILCRERRTCEVFDDELIVQDYTELLEECILIAREDGAVIPDSFKGQMLQKLRSYPPEKGSSMLSDLLNGRPIEWEARNQLFIETALNRELQSVLNKNIMSVINSSNS